jgi:hypothetical protein
VHRDDVRDHVVRDCSLQLKGSTQGDASTLLGKCEVPTSRERTWIHLKAVPNAGLVGAARNGIIAEPGPSKPAQLGTGGRAAAARGMPFSLN